MSRLIAPLAVQATPNTQYYYRYRQWINCQGGGYLEDYNLLQLPSGPTAFPSAAVLNAVKSIVCLRGQLLDGNSKIANGEISIETLPGVNPPEGFQIPHNVPNSVPIVLNDPTSGQIEAQPGLSNDPSQCIVWRLDTQKGFTELRTLRSLRATWVQQWGTLIQNVQAQLAGLTTSPPAAGVVYTGFPGASTNPALAIAYFMMVVLVNTQLYQNVKSGGIVQQFNEYPWISPSSSGCPIVVNPIISTALSRRKVGEGWPKTKGKMQSFGTHG